MRQRLMSPTITQRLIGLIVATVLGVTALLAWQTVQSRDRLLELHQQATRNAVQTALGIVSYYGDLASSGELSEEAARSAAAEAVRQLRYDDGEYFWINDLTPTMIMHPIKPELEGTDLSENTDPDGKHLFLEMVDVVERDGAGFVAYQWPKPGKDDPQPKVSYVAGYAPWGWVVGSGIYVDDVNALAFADTARSGSVFLVVALLLGAITVVTARAIVRPIRRATTLLENGDVDARLDEGRGRTELERLAVALNRTMDRSATVVREVTHAAGELDTAAHELVRASDEIAGHAEGTTTQTETVSVAAREVSSGIDMVAAGTHEMGASISEIAHNAHEAAKIAAEAVEAAQATNQTVAQLGESSAEIDSVVKTITSIAEQTNLLALNATIEAARAGDAGKGFAVVAGEVKELAQETARATGDISERVEGIQQAVNRAAGEIARISEIISRINDFQVTIAGAVEEQTATTNTMAGTVASTADSGRDIATTLDGVVAAAQGTREGIESIRAAAQHLVTTSTTLQQAVNVHRD